MKSLVLPLSGVLAAASLAHGRIVLNEVHFNPPNSDGNYEFLELKSTTNAVESCAGLSILIINNDRVDKDSGAALNVGEVTEVFDIGELSTGSNGLLLLGNGYADVPRGGPWAGAIDPATAVADPAGLGDSDLGPNDGFTVLLVRNFSGVKGDDIDKDNDGLIDWLEAAPPAGALPARWAPADLIDSIGTRDRDGLLNPYVPNNTLTSGANIWATWNTSSLGDRDPDTMARKLGVDTASSAASWYGGKMLATATSSTAIAYQGTRVFNLTPGEVTPGRPNLSAALPVADFRINEVGLNPTGSSADSDRYQYVEIANTANQSRSLDGYWLVLVDSYDGSASGSDSSPGVGAIMEEWNLSDFVTGTNGLLLLGDDFSSTYTAFQDLVPTATGVAEPASSTKDPISTGWGLGDLGFKNGFTLLLVKGYVPPTQKDIDSNDDGVKNATTFTGTIVDQVGFTQIAKTTIGRTYANLADLRSVMPTDMAPDNLSRKPGNTSVSPSAWYGGVYPSGGVALTLGFEDSDPATPGGTFGATWFGGFRGAGTPGLPNLSAPINPASPPVAASIRINEVMINPTNTEANDQDDNNEFIEIVSTNEAMAYLDGLWMLLVNADGTITDGFPLDGYTTGLNGVAIIGDNYDDFANFPYRVSEGSLPPTVAAIDPVVSLGGNDIPNDGVSVLLVRGVKGPITLVGGKPTGDLDPENDGTLLAPSAYTDELVDSICTLETNPGPGYAWISNGPFKVHHVARYPGNYTANTPSSFYYGQIPQTAAASPSIEYAGNWNGTFRGAASPGRPNNSAPIAATTVGSVVLNEVHLNPAGADNNFEFIELLDAGGASRSLNGYYLVVLDNVVNNTGAVRHAWSLDGMSTGPGGLFIMGNHYPIPAENPFSSVIRSTTRTGDPSGRDSLESGFGDFVIAGETDNQNLLLLLVRGFNRYIGFDTDEKAAGVDSGGDGAFDAFAWTGGAAGIHDSIVLRSYIATTPPPASPPLSYPFDGFTYGLADLTEAWFPNPAALFYHPETVARFRGENAANNSGSWYGGDLVGGVSGNQGTALNYVTTDPTHPPVPVGFTGYTTPGQPNLSRNESADPDHDGIPSLLEGALASNPDAVDSPCPLPTAGTVEVSGQTYLAYTWRRIRGGTATDTTHYAAEAYTYTLETSADLATWSSAASGLAEVSTTANADGVTENVTVRLTAPVTAPGGRSFVRLRAGRR